MHMYIYVLSTDIDTFFPMDRICYLSTDRMKLHYQLITALVSTDSNQQILSVDRVNYPLVNNNLSINFYLSTNKDYLLIY